MLFLLLDLALAWLLDRLLGDPAGLPHPVNAIGRLISLLDRAWHPGAAAAPRRAFAAGLALCVLTVGLSGGLVFGLLWLAGCLHPLAFHLLNVYFLYAALAGRCLEVEAGKVARALCPAAAAPAAPEGAVAAVAAKADAPEGLEAARRALAMLVSRDTSRLDQAAAVRATVETVAENTVDGVLSPLFWIFAGCAACLAGAAAGAGTGAAAGAWPLGVAGALGEPGGVGVLAGLGAALAWGFKAASTLDSRVGYKNPRYLYFGRASARLDDALNFLPARLSLAVLPLGALSCRLDARAAWRIGRRDRLKHASPNSAHPEAAVAGALGIALGGPSVYEGRTEDKPWLGDDRRPAEPADIGRACRLMHRSSLLFLLAGLAVLAAVAVAGRALP